MSVSANYVWKCNGCGSEVITEGNWYPVGWWRIDATQKLSDGGIRRTMGKETWTGHLCSQCGAERFGICSLQKKEVNSLPPLLGVWK